jgi:signal peptidase II
MSVWRKRLLWLLVPVLIMAADQLTKTLVREHVGQYDQIEVIDGFFRINFVQNKGAAFGLFSDMEDFGRELLLGVLGGVALILVVIYSLRLPPNEWVAQLGLHMIFAGAIGNRIDRFIVGRVTDFLEFYWGDFRFPAFNVADSAIVMGVCLLLIDTFRPRRKREKPAVESVVETGQDNVPTATVEGEKIHKQGGADAS